MISHFFIFWFLIARWKWKEGTIHGYSISVLSFWYLWQEMDFTWVPWLNKTLSGIFLFLFFAKNEKWVEFSFSPQIRKTNKNKILVSDCVNGDKREMVRKYLGRSGLLWKCGGGAIWPLSNKQTHSLYKYKYLLVNTKQQLFIFRDFITLSFYEKKDHFFPFNTNRHL